MSATASQLASAPAGSTIVEVRTATILAPELRAMTGYEEELVERWQVADTVGLCNELLARCLVAVGTGSEALADARARVQGLTTAERDLALVALRRMSLGDRVDTQIDCPSCAAGNELDFNLAELPQRLPDIAVRVSASLGDGASAELRLPTAGDQAALADAELGDSEAKRRSFVLARVLLRLGEREGPFELAELHALPAHVRRDLSAALDAALPDFELDLDVRCHACGHEFCAPFDVESFFLPS